MLVFICSVYHIKKVLFIEFSTVTYKDSTKNKTKKTTMTLWNKMAEKEVSGRERGAKNGKRGR